MVGKPLTTESQMLCCLIVGCFHLVMLKTLQFNLIYLCDVTMSTSQKGSGESAISSVQLMRECILRSIDGSATLENQRRYWDREEIPNPSQPSIEVKFLEKRCSSFSSPKSQSEKANSEEAKLSEPISATESKDLPLPDFEISGSFEESGEAIQKNNEFEKGEGLTHSNETSPKLKHSGKNNLKLAIRNKSDAIFEDCSTYNISFPDASPELRSGEIFTNSLAGSEFGTSLETSSGSELASSSWSSSVHSPDEQTSLCDTFFPRFVNEESAPSPPVGQVRGTPQQQPARREEDTSAADASSSRRRSSKKVRRRHRKSLARDPVVYDCPKCGVSYVVASRLSNDGVCFHCDMWKSVEPEFVKREKLLTWNTCRIC